MTPYYKMGNVVSFKKEFGLIVIGALVFTASFLWKDLLTDIEETYFPKKCGMTGRVLYVFVVTSILILLAIHLRTRLGLTSDQLPVKVSDKPEEDGPSILPNYDLTTDFGVHL
jgi:hypothetical protein